MIWLSNKWHAMPTDNVKKTTKHYLLSCSPNLLTPNWHKTIDDSALKTKRFFAQDNLYRLEQAHNMGNQFQFLVAFYKHRNLTNQATCEILLPREISEGYIYTETLLKEC